MLDLFHVFAPIVILFSFFFLLYKSSVISFNINHSIYITFRSNVNGILKVLYHLNVISVARLAIIAK